VVAVAALKTEPAQDVLVALAVAELIQVAQAVAPHRVKGLLVVPARLAVATVLAVEVHRLSVSARMLELNPCKGGDGLASSITGTSVTRAGGGGGGLDRFGAGGAGGAARALICPTQWQEPLTLAAAAAVEAVASGPTAALVVRVWSSSPYQQPITAVSQRVRPTVTTSGSNTILQFNSSGKLHRVSHFAKVIDGIVAEVLVIEQDVIDTGMFGKIPSLFVQTSYNTYGGQHPEGRPLRKNFAGIGYTYDPLRDAFIAPQPFASWH